MSRETDSRANVRAARIYAQAKANAELERVGMILKRPAPSPDFFGSAFPFPKKPDPHVCPKPEPPKFKELLRLHARADMDRPTYNTWDNPPKAPELPNDREWFDDVFMAVRTASMVGKRVQLRTDWGHLVLEVEQ